MTDTSAAPSTETDPIAVLLAGATSPILRVLQGTGDGATVLDLACGTGEPAATILREHPSWRVIGVDTAEEVVRAAQARVPDARAEFRVGSMTDLDLPDGSVDAVVSRMGALMMGDTEATAREIARVLRPGGRIGIAAWAEQEHNPFMAVAVDSLRAAGVPGSRVPDFASWFDAMAAEGVREGWLRAAGVTTAGSGRFTWSAFFPDFDSWWHHQTRGGSSHRGGSFAAVLAELDRAGRDRVRAAMVERMSGYRDADGGYAIPATAQLVTGTR